MEHNQITIYQALTPEAIEQGFNDFFVYIGEEVMAGLPNTHRCFKEYLTDSSECGIFKLREVAPRMMAKSQT